MKCIIERYIYEQGTASDFLALFAPVRMVVARFVFGDAISVTAAIELDLPEDELNLLNDQLIVRARDEICGYTVWSC
jgi:hypothetical protein